MKWNIFLIAAVAIFGITNINAQVTLAGWDINGQNSAASNPLSANNTASNITVGGLTLGGGLTACGTTSTFGGRNWSEGSTAADAVTGNDFIFLTLTANASHTISLDGISAYNIRRSSTGPNSFLWQYQVGANSWIDIGSTITASGTTSGGNTQSAITLSGIPALQGVSSSSTIGLRLLGWGATGSTGTGFLNHFQTGDDFIITGSVGVAPAPATFTTWTGTGSPGTWSNGTAGQFGGNYTNDLANTVTFAGTGTAVTASGPPQAGNLFFDSTGYTLTGAVQLGVGSITTNGAISTTISANISGNGSSGLTKAGAGTLLLSGSNSYNGTTTLNAGTVTFGNANAFGSAGNITFSGGTPRPVPWEIGGGSLARRNHPLYLERPRHGVAPLQALALRLRIAKPALSAMACEVSSWHTFPANPSRADYAQASPVKKSAPPAGWFLEKRSRPHHFPGTAPQPIQVNSFIKLLPRIR